MPRTTETPTGTRSMMIPANPCCDACVISALQRGQFDYTQPFILFSGLRSMSARERAAMIESVVKNHDGDIVLMVSCPAPPVEEEPEEVDVPETTDSDPLSEEMLRDVLGLDH